MTDNSNIALAICDGEQKYYTDRGGSVDQCPNCDHWNATIINLDIEGFNTPDLRIFCRCCGIYEDYD